MKIIFKETLCGSVAQGKHNEIKEDKLMNVFVRGTVEAGASVLHAKIKADMAAGAGDFGIKPTKRSNANVFYVVDLEDAFVRYLTHI